MGFDLMSNFTQFIGGGSVKLWSSGETVLQWDYRRSPLDGDVYQRKTATGSGTTDPADDVTNYVAVSYRRSAALATVPTYSVSAASGAIALCTEVSVAAISAGVRTKILAATGRGSCGFLGWIPSITTTGNTCRIEVVADGRTVYDATQSVGSTGAIFPMQIPVGGLSQRAVDANYYVAVPDPAPIVFRRTLDVWVTPSAVTSGTNSRLLHQVKGEQ